MKRKYPSQDDAQILVDIMNHPQIYAGGTTDEFKKLATDFNTFPKNWTRLYNKAFGAKSPWKYEFDSKRNKRELKWDSEKAALLKL